MNLKYSRIILLAIFLFPIFIFSQKAKYASFVTARVLKTNANAITRNSTTEITIEAVDKIVIHKKRVITVLNKLGIANAPMSIAYDNDTKITKLSAKIYDAFGKEIKKYKKRDFLEVSAVEHGTLYSDDRIKYLRYTPTNYPYTVVFETTYKTNSTAFIPRWFPINDYYISVEKSEYILKNPLNLPIRTLKNNFENYPVEDTSSPFNLHYILKNQAAIKAESNSLSYLDLMPSLFVSLNNFSLKGVKGFASNWEEFGKWMHQKLLTENTQLKTSTKLEIKSLVKNAHTDLEKAKIIYEYMQRKTRYIGVQIGIGGWKPIPANEVDNVGYGDCKGLTNYMKALLDVVGIKSYHTLVYAKRNRNIIKNFPSLQGNHMILNIPNNGNDIWLECTSQTIPFGFLGDFTDDRDVLVVTPEGGVIKHTPKYINHKNSQETIATIKLTPSGNLSAAIERTSKGIKYDKKYHLDKKSKKNLENYYTSKVWNYNNNTEINHITLLNNKETTSFKETVQLSITNYATSYQENMLFKINVFNRFKKIPKHYRNRQNPLKINRGFIDRDISTITLPEGYSITSLPKEKKIENKFGLYHIQFERINEKTIKYRRTLSLKKGIYPKEDYALFRKYCKLIAKYDNLRIELTKK
ncbi:DUF3857 domain-containing protein [Tenacibaculum maritimum]|uniref:DUF3857 domain-containing protein n=1 Tax=Tenacibaculum maritimum TaxID=107401 RepID=UPI003875CDA3